jgi:hypothetical protein
MHVCHASLAALTEEDLLFGIFYDSFQNFPSLTILFNFNAVLLKALKLLSSFSTSNREQEAVLYVAGPTSNKEN